MMLVNGVTYVPLRGVVEAIGAKIEWDNKTKMATQYEGINHC